MKNNKVGKMPNVEDLGRPYVEYNLNDQVTLYQMPFWKTYKDEETNEQLIINLLDVKYLQCYEGIVADIRYWKYVVYIKVGKTGTDKIETTESIYRQIERDLEMS